MSRSGHRTVCFSVDVEQDCPPYLNGYRGMEEGMPRLLALLRELRVPATFFCTGDTARRYPKIMREIVADGHELGCHGDTHRRFDAMTLTEAEAELDAACMTLRRFGEVTSFRAPNLSLPPKCFPLLLAAGLRIDSSVARYKFGEMHRPAETIPGLKRVPVSATSSVLRLPRLVRRAWLGCLGEPLVLFVHPWEFVDLRNEKLRLDCRFRTGETALECLRSTLNDLGAQGSRWARVREVCGLLDCN